MKGNERSKPDEVGGSFSTGIECVLKGLTSDTKLMPANYVKPYFNRGKTDAIDTEVICEAARRPTMRFAEIKAEDQQAGLAIHRTRDLAVRQSTQMGNMIRSLLRELGHILWIGIEAVVALAKRHLEGDHPDMQGYTEHTLSSVHQHERARRRLSIRFLMLLLAAS